MAGKKIKSVKANWEYLNELFKTYGTSQVEIAKILGHSHSYFTHWVNKGEIPVADLEKIRELLDVDDALLYPTECDIDLAKIAEKAVDAVNDKILTELIAEIGELRGRIVELEKKADNPVPVSIPMNARDMANRVMGALLEGGWVSKDEVLTEFNKHRIPIEYITDALRANHAISATSGVANGARTFYIKESEVGIA